MAAAVVIDGAIAEDMIGGEWDEIRSTCTSLRQAQATLSVPPSLTVIRKETC